MLKKNILKIFFKYTMKLIFLQKPISYLIFQINTTIFYTQKISKFLNIFECFFGKIVLFIFDYLKCKTQK